MRRPSLDTVLGHFDAFVWGITLGFFILAALYGEQQQHGELWFPLPERRL